MAEPTKKPAGAVPVVTPTGKVGYLPPELAADAGAQGVRGATDRELRTEQLKANEAATDEALRAKFEGAGLMAGIEGTLGPELAGAARGATLGLSDPAILGAAEALGGPGAREAVRQRLLDYQAYAPVRSFTSELGGAIGASALTEGGAAPEAAGGLLARGARVLGRGAAEGAVYGAGGAVSESALKDERLTGEALVGGAAHGALGGMLISGALHGAGELVSGLRGPRGTAAAYDAIAGRTFGEAAPGIGRDMAAVEGAMQKAETRAHMPEAQGPFRTPGEATKASVFDAPAEAAIKVGTKGDEGKAGQLREFWTHRKEIADGADRIEAHTRDVTKSITEQQAAGRVTDMATFGDAKVNHMEKLVAPSRFGEQSSVVRSWMQDAQERLASMVGDPNSGLSTAAVKRFDGHMQRLTAAMESGDGHKLFTAADNFKRFLGKEAEFGRSPFGKSEAARAFEDLYQGEGGLMRVLEHEAWGKAGDAQRAVNAATTQWLGMGKRFRSSFTTEHGSTMGAPDYVGNSQAVSSFMGRLTKAANDLDAQAFRDAVQARRAFLDATEKSYDHGTAAKNAITKERAALDKMEKAFDQATKETSLINQFQRMQEAEQSQRIGGALGLLTDTLSKPATTLQRLAQLEAHTQSVLKKLGGDTSSLVGGGKGATMMAAPAGLPAPKGKGQGFFSTLLDKTPNPGGAVGGVAESKRSQYQRRAEALAALQANPAQVADRLGRSLDPFALSAPKATATATATALAGLQFLSSKLPPSRQDPYSLQPQLQPRTRASDAEISQFMRYTAAIDDPLIVLREAKSGTLTRDHVEAVKAVYPRLYDQMRTEVMQHLIDSKSPLPYGKRIQLGILLDIPTDKTLSPDFLTAIQATYTSAEKAGAESPPPTLSRPIEVAGSQQTAMQQAVERAQ